MKKTRQTWVRVLKIFHLFFVSIWLGSWVCLLLLLLSGLNNTGGGQILDIVSLLYWAVVIPSVIGSLITGILFSATTNWGFFKHRWIVIKYAVNIFPIVFGALKSRLYLENMLDIAKNDSSGALTNPTFIHDRNVFVIFLVVQVVLLVAAFYLSVFKPRIGPQG